MSLKILAWMCSEGKEQGTHLDATSVEQANSFYFDSVWTSSGLGEADGECGEGQKPDLPSSHRTHTASHTWRDPAAGTNVVCVENRKESRETRT